MKNYFSSYKPVRKPVALAVLGLIITQNAAAQQTAAENKPVTVAESPARENEATQKLDTVVVTSGSRIKRDVFSSPAPIQVIKNEDAALAGFTSTAQILQSTSVTGGAGQINNAFGGYVTDGGPGANTVGLRGFAPTRSLVLLNGRRMSPSGTRGSVGAADLNTLPNAIVDRIEVLKDGASSIYGSDAVAGVINIITKKDLTGIRLDASLSQTEHGGGNAYNFSAAGGMVNDHSRFLVSYNFNENTRMTLGQRDWTRCNTDSLRTSVNGVVGAWGSGDFIDPQTGKAKCYPITGTGSNGVTINTLGTATTTGVGAAGSVGTSFNRWRPNSAVTTGLAGWEGVGGGSNNLNVRDTFDPRVMNNTVMSPVRNHNLYAQGAFDVPALGGDAEAYWELLFNRRDSSQVGFRQLSMDYTKGSPLIPANLQFSTFLAAGGSLMTNGQATGVRAFIGAGNSYSSQAVDFTRAVAGLRGSFAKINWDYDISVQHAESKGKYVFDGFRTDRLSQSMNVVASGSSFACANTANGCVAAPALTSAVVGGQLPAAWLGFVYDNFTGMTKYKEDIVSASTTGKLFKLPYGDVKGAIGAEFRRMSIDDTPSVDQQTANIYNFTSSTPTRGSDNATDVFAEIEVPLLKDLPLAKDLTLNGSARRADYKSYGSGSTYKIGALWAPASWISLRGTNGTSYRAPALFEQFVGATTGFLNQSGDPCNTPTPGSVRATNCASEGLPATFSQTQSITSITKGGRDSGLAAETSKNSSWGVILQPTLPTGWGDVSIALDRFDVKVDNGVAQIGTASILALCYDDPAFRKGGGYCNLVTRNATTNALSVNNSYINLSTDVARGYEYNIRYTNDVGIGKLRVNLSATEYHSQASRLFTTDPLTESNGRVGIPRWSGAFDVNYAVKGWTAYYGMEWVGKTSSYEYYQRRSTSAAQAATYDPATSIYQMRTPNYFLHSLSLSYSDSVSKWKTTVGVRNIGDKTPPTISQGFANRVGNAPLYSGYDYLGRRFFMNVSKTF
ncbi:TonB-dependent receptor domain-containing protein [Roseateles sp.]|uniref:TonB-dependent receptor domain-containing protein n=1 Tax=Roseateles sp. TaxID=1971397 RepID=UPI003BAC3A54